MQNMDAQLTCSNDYSYMLSYSLPVWQWKVHIGIYQYAQTDTDMTKTRNGLENGLVNGLSQIVWKASCITVKLF